MNPFKSFMTYIRASKTELEKVTWPTREETIRYSVLVTIVCVATAGLFASLDFVFRAGLDTLVTAVRPDIAAVEPLDHSPEPIEPDVQPFEPDTGGGIEAVDEFGNPTDDFNLETIPLEGGEGSPFTITPESGEGTEE